MSTKIQIIDDAFSPEAWNALVTHPMQSWEWGVVRKNEGKNIVRFVESTAGNDACAVYLMTTHPVPFTNLQVGYIPKSAAPTPAFLKFLKTYAQEHHLIFVKLEPNTSQSTAPNSSWQKLLTPSDHPLFTRWNQVLDISTSPEDLLKKTHPKTRYNIRLAEKKGVTVHELSNEEGYKIFERLYFETCARQKYRGHTPAYHRNIWNTLYPSTEQRPSTFSLTNFTNLQSHILVAFYKDKPLSVFQLWHFKDTMYYVYGGSSEEFKNVMAANLLMWESIKLAKNKGCNMFDMWGSLPADYDPQDPWAGFTRFKQGYGTTFVQYVGSYDLVVNPLLYKLYSLAQTLRQKFVL